jgi:electron transfer flavoprotein beta subunit
MHIVVCVKQIPNPEAAFSMLTVDEQAKKIVPAAGLQLVMSPFDEQALEAALRIREALGEAKISAITTGPESARNVLKHALAMGADDAVLISGDTLPEANGEVTAIVLARAIERIGPVDLVLTGRQAADSDAGVVGCGVAELLGIPVVTFAQRVEVVNDSVHVERVLADGFETVETRLPAAVTVSNEIGAARAPSLRETMRAARKPLAVLSPAEIGLSPDEIARVGARRVRERLYVPSKNARCELIEGAEASVQAAALVRRLREARLI